MAMGNENFWKGFYVATSLLGLVFMVFEILIYRQTIISIYIPVSIVLVVGLVTFYFNRQHYKKTHLVSGNFYPILQNLVSWGFISSYIFMAANYYSAEKAITEHKFEIKEKNSMSGPKGHSDERKPLVTIDYFNSEKELVFPYAYTDKVNKADSVIVKIRKGGLGFDILDDYDVID